MKRILYSTLRYIIPALLITLLLLSQYAHAAWTTTVFDITVPKESVKDSSANGPQYSNMGSATIAPRTNYTKITSTPVSEKTSYTKLSSSEILSKTDYTPITSQGISPVTSYTRISSEEVNPHTNYSSLSSLQQYGSLPNYKPLSQTHYTGNGEYLDAIYVTSGKNGALTVGSRGNTTSSNGSSTAQGINFGTSSSSSYNFASDFGEDSIAGGTDTWGKERDALQTQGITISLTRYNPKEPLSEDLYVELLTLVDSKRTGNDINQPLLPIIGDMRNDHRLYNAYVYAFHHGIITSGQGTYLGHSLVYDETQHILTTDKARAQGISHALGASPKQVSLGTNQEFLDTVLATLQ